MLTSFLQTWRFIQRHPLGSQNFFHAIKLWIRWQIGARILRMPIVVPFVGESQLVAELGMTGATGNIYTGLHEFVDMAFCLHLLRSGDLFVDVGANVGSYTVLASKVAGANSLALEPVPQTFERLRRNININEINSLVDARCCAIGAISSVIKFSSDCDTTNQVIGDEYKGAWIEVPVVPLDEILQTLKPTLIKIDVEGYEPKVIDGAKETLKSDSLLAVLLETVNPEMESILKGNGFISAYYDPFTRELSTSSVNHVSNNYLWVKNLDHVIERCQFSPKYQALGIDF